MTLGMQGGRERERERERRERERDGRERELSASGLAEGVVPLAKVPFAPRGREHEYSGLFSE